MDFQHGLETGDNKGSEGDYVRVLGFVGNDLIYGFSNS